MLLVIDVGNTNMVIGVYENDRLVKDWRIRTEQNTTEDEFNVLMNALLKNASIKPSHIEKTIISCVVPAIMNILDAYCRKYLKHSPSWVDARLASDILIRYKNPAEVGADRIVNSVAAYHKYKTSLIIIDFGTATTFDAVDKNGYYIGGVISPGIMISSEALFMRASKLPRVEIFRAPEKVIGSDTLDSIKSGIIYGYAGLVDGVVKRMTEQMLGEMQVKPKVVATGGLARLMSGVAETIESVEPQLTLEGLRLLSLRL